MALPCFSYLWAFGNYCFQSLSARPVPPGLRHLTVMNLGLAMGCSLFGQILLESCQ